MQIVARAGAEVPRVLDLDPGRARHDRRRTPNIEAGRRAGTRTVGVHGGFASPERLVACEPDVLIGSLAEVPDLIRGWAGGRGAFVIGGRRSRTRVPRSFALAGRPNHHLAQGGTKRLIVGALL